MNVKRTKRQPVLAGETLKKLTSFLKGVSEKLFNLFDTLGDEGLKIVDQKDMQDGGQWLKLEYNGNNAEITITPADDKGVFNIILKSPMGGTTKFDKISETDIDTKVKSALKDIFSSTQLSSSNPNKLKVTLQSVTSATGVDINLTAIKANYDTSAAIQDLEAILGDDEFVSQVTAEPISFEITDNGECFDIEETCSFDASDTIVQLIQAAMQLWANLKVIHWAARGLNSFELHSKSDNLAFWVMNDVDCFGEYLVESKCPAVNPLLNQCNLSLISDQQGFTAEEGYCIMKSEISKYVSILETLYVNFPHDFQSVLDNMIRTWKKESEYFLTRATM